MADDTRQQSPSPKVTPEDLSREALTLDPNAKSFAGNQWQDGKAQPYNPQENANLMAGGTQHTAGGKVPEVTLWNALTVGQPITEVHKRPCVRDSLLTGMGAGFATGGIRVIFSAPIWKACNWAVGAFSLGSIVMYNYCQYRRQAEREGMMRAVEILNRNEAEKRLREERKQKLREERREAKDKEQDAQLTAMKERSGGGKPWWKVW